MNANFDMGAIMKMAMLAKANEEKKKEEELKDFMTNDFSFEMAENMDGIIDAIGENINKLSITETLDYMQSLIELVEKAQKFYETVIKIQNKYNFKLSDDE